MIALALSAAFVGFVHSLAPGHWLPVVLTAKANRWKLAKALWGALALACGHVVVSTAIGLVSIVIGASVFKGDEEELERKAALLLLAFGIVYAAVSRFRHSSCHGHEHHGPEPEKGRKAPLFFLFSIGLVPCVAVLPVFLASAALGAHAVAFSMGAFALGVVASLAGSTLVATLGLLKLDHPVFEHHGDVITGVGVALMGLLLYLFPI